MIYSHFPLQATCRHNYNPYFGDTCRIVHIICMRNQAKRELNCYIINFGFKYTNHE